jgi:EAL domain-containing protein (putative c-di-GMP-specific phosphodiesterase class I)
LFYFSGVVYKTQKNLLKSDWRVFLNIYRDKYFNFENEKVNVLEKISKTIDLEVKPIILSEKEKEIMKDEYAIVLLVESLNKFKYYKDLGFSQERFNKFKNIMFEYIKLNAGHFRYKLSLGKELEVTNKKINTLINENSNDLIQRHKKLIQIRKDFYTKLFDRAIITKMSIRKFIDEVLSLENIKKSYGH